MAFELKEEKFTELLLADLLVYILRIVLKDNTNKGEVIATLINKWSDKVDSDSKIVQAKYAKTIAMVGEEDMTEDVAMILLDITNLDKKIAKKEFKESMLKTLLKEVAL